MELNDTITLTSLNYSNTISNGGHSTAGTFGPFTITGSNTGVNAAPYFSAGIGTATANPWSYNASPKIKLDGADADIEINGISLLKTMQEIQSRLNLLQPNTALEKEWEELYALGKKYRDLEQQIKEKQATWDRLKAMPPPEID
jgi:hypothetical protein